MTLGTPSLASSPCARAPIDAADVSIGVDRMLRIQGYTDLARVRRAVRAAAERAARLAETVLRPEVCYRRLAIDACTDGRLRLDGGSELRCDAFSRFLPEAREAVLFVLTAGSALDEEASRLNAADDLLGVLFLENAGWLAVEAITRAFIIHLRTLALADGLRLTRRMGPGYVYRAGDADVQWPLEDQHPLFAILDDGALPVRVLESGAMIPKMSRSGLVGLVPSSVTG